MIIDAHLHLHDEALENIEFDQYFDRVAKALVNGTEESDWSRVIQLHDRYPDQVVPFFGVHPWKVSQHSEFSLATLKTILINHPKAGVGEIGIDKWVRGSDFARQKEFFVAQLQLARELHRPITIHCLKAWGTLMEILDRQENLPPFLLHAYSGPADYVKQFVEMGAYFSFSPYFLKLEKARKLAPFQIIPDERFLIETDAPAMLGPENTWSEEQFHFSEQEQHPANISKLYDCVAEWKKMPLPEVKKSVQENLERFLRKE